MLKKFKTLCRSLIILTHSGNSRISYVKQQQLISEMNEVALDISSKTDKSAAADALGLARAAMKSGGYRLSSVESLLDVDL